MTIPLSSDAAPKNPLYSAWSSIMPGHRLRNQVATKAWNIGFLCNPQSRQAFLASCVTLCVSAVLDRVCMSQQALIYQVYGCKRPAL